MHYQSHTDRNTINITNHEVGVVRALFELLVKLPNHVRYDTIAWAIESKDPSMMKLIALCHGFGLRGYIHYYFLTPDKFREMLFTPNAGN
jgi:hypothetical protein